MADTAIAGLPARQTRGRRLSDGLAAAGLARLAALALVLLVAAVTIGTAAAVVAGRLLDDQHAVTAFALVCVVLALFLVILPIVLYVTVGQQRRLEVIRGYYTPGIVAEYFDQFWAGREGVADLIYQWRNRDRRTAAELAQLTDDERQRIERQRQRLEDALKQKFNELMNMDFGFSMYAAPLALLTVVAAIVLYFGFLGGISLAKVCVADGKSCAGAVSAAVPLLGIKLDLVSIAAIFGAYAWVASDSITRNYQSTFHPSELLWYALRLIIAVPLGEAISMLSLSSLGADGLTKVTAAVPGWGAFLAFTISMFSLDAISKYLSAGVNKLVPNVQLGSGAERDDLVVRLPGISEEIGRSLAAEGVTTIAQLVAVDPVRLSIRSGLPFDFVLATVDAAILWTYVGGKITVFREFGFKGASNVLAYAETTAAPALPAGPAVPPAAPALAPLAPAPAAAPASLKQQLAEKASIAETGFDNIVAQLVRDLYARFIRRLLSA